MIIIVRALLGIAGATIMPSTLALIATIFKDPKQMGKAIGLWATAMTVGVAIGPMVGGLLLSAFWWGSVFLIAAPVMAILLIAGPGLLPEARNPEAGKLDPVSVVLSLAAILPVVYGLKELAKAGFAVLPVVAIVAGVIFGVIFVRRQNHLKDPLVDLRLFGIAAVGGGLVSAMSVAAVQGGNSLLATLHLQLVEGFSPLKTALWLLIPTAVLIFGIQMATPLAQRFRPATVLSIGVLVGAVGMVILTRVDSNAGLGMLVTGLSVVYLGVSGVGPVVGQLIMVAAPPERAGSAASLNGMVGELGLALGIAGLGSIATIGYHSQLTIPDGVPPDAAEAAKEGIASAATAAQQVPGTPGTQLMANAQEAFTGAYNVTTGILAVLMVGLAGLVFLTLRKVPPMGAPPAGEAAPEGADDSSEAVSAR
jgi:DHA2 family multidrug resistance protein-like MFS transporter